VNLAALRICFMNLSKTAMGFAGYAHPGRIVVDAVAEQHRS